MKKQLIKLLEPLLAYLARRRERRIRGARATHNARLMYVGGTVRRV